MSTAEVMPGAFPEIIVRPKMSWNRVLIAEDNAMFRKILRSWMEQWGYEATVAEDGLEAWTILQQASPPQLLILDWVMPQIDGVELCHRIRSQKPGPYQYILLVTAKDEKQDKVIGLEAGADDYVTKPFDRNELRARLRVGKRILTLQDDLIRAREELRYQATHDVLTGSLNRRAIVELLRGELERAARTQSPTGILLLDLDHFKKVNDTCGHLAGDAVLSEIARRIGRAVRAYDAVGRYGGEEFLVVLPGCDREQTEQGAERIRATIAGAPVLADHSTVSVTVSIGAAVALLGTRSEMEMLAAADAALYNAKDSGRNRVTVSELGYPG